MDGAFLTICGPILIGPYGVDGTFSVSFVGGGVLDAPQNPRSARSGAQRGVSVDGAARWRPSGEWEMPPAQAPGRYPASGDSKGGTPFGRAPAASKSAAPFWFSFGTKENGKNPNPGRKRQPTAPYGARARAAHFGTPSLRCATLRDVFAKANFYRAIKICFARRMAPRAKKPALQTDDTFLTICGPILIGPYGRSAGVCKTVCRALPAAARSAPYLFSFISYLFSCPPRALHSAMDSCARSLGDTPGMRPACPSVRGRMRASFSRASSVSVVRGA